MMANDPRKFIVARCDEKGLVQRVDAASRRTFFDQLGAIGDIEALNDIGGGDVGRGLRTLASVSQSIRVTGDTSLPARLDQQGTAAVYEASNINPRDIVRARQFNPGVVNRAQAQAELIIDKVKAGNFELEDIPEAIQDIQNLNYLISGIFSGGSDALANDVSVACGASPFAMDLIRFAPKFKYLFVMQVELNAPYNLWQGDMTDKLAFVVKHSNRPQVDFEYEEVNMYNFWTRVPKRTVYQPMTMRFYDDSANAGGRFYDNYIKSMSPIANMGHSQMMGPEWLQANSMSATTVVDDFNVTNRVAAASLGKLSDNNINIIKSIKLFHVYDAGRYMNVYTFHNPKILNFTPNELDMAETGDGSELEFQFAYDAMFMETDYDIFQKGGIYDIKQLSIQNDLGMYPMTQSEIPPWPKPGGADTITSQAKNFVVETGAAITGAINATFEAGTRVVSNAFDAVDKFAGSIFTK
jgi:hypothetical protein